MPGRLSFRPSAPSLRTFAVQVPKAPLKASNYWLVLLDSDGNVIRQWPLSVL